MKKSDQKDATSISIAQDETGFKKIVKDGSNFSFLKILITGLTAVTMAVISSKITSTVNSLLLAALVSVGTAIFSEIYRIILSISSAGAKKIALPVIEKTEKTLTEEAEEKPETQTEEKETNIFKRFTNIVSVYFKRNPFMRTALLFTAISIVTVGISYFVSHSSETPINTTYTTVQSSENLTEQEKQNIIDSAVDKAKSSMSPTPTPTQTTISTDDARVEELEKENTALQDRIKALEKSSSTDKTNIENLQKTLADLQTEMQKLQAEQNSEQTETEATPTPSTTVTPTPQPDTNSQGTN